MHLINLQPHTAMLHFLSPDEWAAVGALGSWVAGIGSLLAVAVALWLSLRQTKSRIRVSVSKISCRTWSVDIANRGRHGFAYDAVSWSVRRGWKRKHFLIQMYHTAPPETKKLLILPGFDGSPTFQIAALVAKLDLTCKLNTLRVQVYTSSIREGGPTFKASRKFRVGTELVKEAKRRLEGSASDESPRLSP